jgi:hypothetical protein
VPEYYRSVTIASPADLRSGLYEAYASQPAGLASAARVAIRPVVSACCRIALAAETRMLRGHIVTQNLTFVARKGAGLVNSGAGNPA